MTYREYLLKMISLTDQLNEVFKSKPYDLDAYNSIFVEIERVHASEFQRRRRRSWFMFVVICFLILLFGFIVWGIIRPL